MPNHVTHLITVTGPTVDVLAFQSKHLVEYKVNESAEMAFDFNTVVPMPELIRDSESSSTVDYGLALLGREDLESNPFTKGANDAAGGALEAMLGHPWAQAEGLTDIFALARWINEHHPGAVDAARKAIAAYEKYGSMNWYDWSIKYWGTKWNAYNLGAVSFKQIAGVGDLLFHFDTAWSPPVPVLERLAGMYPSLTIKVVAFDEGWNFAYAGQSVAGVWQGDFGPATDELYEHVYGEKPEPDEDDGQGEDMIVDDEVDINRLAAEEPYDPDKHLHVEGDGSYWLKDARGIEIARVCDVCLPHKIKGYRPDVLNDPNYVAEEPIEEE